MEIMMSYALILAAFTAQSVFSFSPIKTFSVIHRPGSLGEPKGPLLPSACTLSASSALSTPTPSSPAFPRISSTQIQELESKGYVVIENFLPESLQSELRSDVRSLRQNDKFNIAKIGQDNTNALNTDIRIAETCFLGEGKLGDFPSDSRDTLYSILDKVREELPQNLDKGLTELLYAYYPRGGFYRRHRDAIAGSASTLRKYSLLLYLNENWDESKGGQLRMHMDSGGDFLPEGEEPQFIDVLPSGGTLVLFKSDQVPHEVIDTNAERAAVVGWYNRPVTAGDIAELSDVNPMRVVGLVVAAALVTAGLINILG